MTSEEENALVNDPVDSPEAFLTKTFDTTKEIGYEQSVARIVAACYQGDPSTVNCESKTKSAVALFHQIIGREE
jgi:hypothetical protein